MARHQYEELFWAIAGVAGFLLIWQLVVSVTVLGDLIPGPVDIFKSFFVSFVVPVGQRTIQEHALISLVRVLVGYALGVTLGIMAGIGMGVSKMFEAIFKPIFEVLRPIPTIAWIPLAILWFGVGEIAKYYIIFYSTFVILTINSYAAVKQVNPELIGAAKMLGATERQIFPKVILPSCIPQIFAGMQTALSASWMSVIAAEMIKSTEGLGWMIIMGQQTANTVQILAGMVAIAVIGLLMASLMRTVEGKLLSWNIRRT